MRKVGVGIWWKKAVRRSFLEWLGCGALLCCSLGRVEWWVCVLC